MKYLAITAVLCLILASASFAGNVTITEVLTGGNLTLTMPDAFSLSGVTIGGASTQDASADATYTVEDSRGTGLGWNLGLQISQFTTSGTPARTIATNKFAVRLLLDSDMVCVYGQARDGNHGPLSQISSKTTVQSSEVKCIVTHAGYGMGKYTLLTDHILTVDANTYAGTYTATLTATLNNAP